MKFCIDHVDMRNHFLRRKQNWSMLSGGADPFWRSWAPGFFLPLPDASHGQMRGCCGVHCCRCISLLLLVACGSAVCMSVCVSGSVRVCGAGWGAGAVAADAWPVCTSVLCVWGCGAACGHGCCCQSTMLCKMAHKIGRAGVASRMEALWKLAGGTADREPPFTASLQHKDAILPV